MNVIAKWRDSAWKDILCDIPKSAIEYLMPDLAAKMDQTVTHVGIKGIEKVARSMLGHGMPLPEVAEITELTIDELQQLQPR